MDPSIPHRRCINLMHEVQELYSVATQTQNVGAVRFAMDLSNLATRLNMAPVLPADTCYEDSTNLALVEQQQTRKQYNGPDDVEVIIDQLSAIGLKVLKAVLSMNGRDKSDILCNGARKRSLVLYLYYEDFTYAEIKQGMGEISRALHY